MEKVFTATSKTHCSACLFLCLMKNQRYLGYTRLQKSLFLRLEIENPSAFIKWETGKRKWTSGREPYSPHSVFFAPVSYSSFPLPSFPFDERFLRCSKEKINKNHMPHLNLQKFWWETENFFYLALYAVFYPFFPLMIENLHLVYSKINK